jgi:hypothetical protein
MWALRQTISFFRFAWPHLLWAVVWAFGFAFKLCFLAVVSAFRGVATMDTVVKEWVKEAILHGFPWMWERELTFLFQVLFVMGVLAGWFIMLFTAGVIAWYTGDYVLEFLSRP